MKHVVDANLTDTTLAKWQGATAILWMYHVSLGRLAIQLSRPNDPEVLYLVAIGCKRIHGPFRWMDASISVTPRSDREIDEARYEVVDAASGFELTCSSVTLVRGPAGEFDTSFEGFLGKAD